MKYITCFGDSHRLPVPARPVPSAERLRAHLHRQRPPAARDGCGTVVVGDETKAVGKLE